ncbi:hypothetical protein ZWY2020_026025 [Hordeum vulgare]|nr:hypothetical protein ZWY2020_026025 [Hordeum vulgare]
MPRHRPPPVRRRPPPWLLVGGGVLLAAPLVGVVMAATGAPRHSGSVPGSVSSPRNDNMPESADHARFRAECRAQRTVAAVCRRGSFTRTAIS